METPVSLPDKNPLFVLVGESKAGKTDLSFHLVNVWHDHRRPLAYLRTLTSRRRRPQDPTEDTVYEFTSRLVILDLKRRGLLVEFVDYGGNLYGVSRSEVARVLGAGMGIIAATESGCRDFEQAGLHVVPIKILPKNRPAEKATADALRKVDDAARTELSMDYYAFLDNDFGPHGRAASLAELQRKIMQYLSR